MRRYRQMVDLVAQVKPRTIIEVGVHEGKRAVMLCEAALKYRRHDKTILYTGFDVFDTESAEFQQAALNGKGTTSEQRARDRLTALVPLLEFDFVVGDTAKTLKGKLYMADFAFIDGDHRVEVIRSDYQALKGSTCVAFDDYYRPGAAGEIPDLDKYGANQLVDELKAEGRRVEILPQGDRCNHGAMAHIAVVWR